jgi:hypothetical protein
LEILINIVEVLFPRLFEIGLRKVCSRSEHTFPRPVFFLIIPRVGKALIKIKLNGGFIKRRKKKILYIKFEGFDFNPMDPKFLKQLEESDRTLTKLDLSEEGIGDERAQALAKALPSLGESTRKEPNSYRVASGL